MLRVLKSGSSLLVLGEKAGKALVEVRRRKGISVENGKPPISNTPIPNTVALMWMRGRRELSCLIYYSTCHKIEAAVLERRQELSVLYAQTVTYNRHLHDLSRKKISRLSADQ